MTVSLN
jgi:transcriptional regulator with XRE-family HTH domain